MIPKRIITTWICDPVRDKFSERHREILKVCVSSWLRLMPDYEIIIVSLGNLKHMLMTNAEEKWLDARIEEGNFIACSQWARLRWLQHGGGVFLDADVEAVRRFDPLLDMGFTVGHLGNGQRFANNAVMASPANHQFLREQLDYLLGIKETEHPEYGNISGPFMLTHLLNKKGFDGVDQDVVVENINVRRSAVFYPYNWNQAWSADKVQDDTLAVHHWATSWRGPEKQTTHQWRIA